MSAARRAGVAARYREIRLTKGHDAFLVEWDQLATILQEVVHEPAACVSEWRSPES